MTTFEFDHQLIHHQNNLRRFAWQLTTNHADASDLLQDTNVKAISNKEKFIEFPDKNMKGWLFTIMKNTFINNFRKNQKKKMVHDDTSEQVFLNTPIGQNSEDPESEYSHNEILDLLESLDDKHKEPLKMYITGYKYYEIAEHLDMKLGTIKSRIYFTRKKLRSLIDFENINMD